MNTDTVMFYTTIMDSDRRLCSVLLLTRRSLVLRINNVKLTNKDLNWIITESRLNRWSQLEKHFSRYVRNESEEVSNEMMMQQAILLLQTVISNSTDIEDDKMSILSFLTEQLKLVSVPPSRRRYSPHCIIAAFCLYMISPSAYEKFRDTFCCYRAKGT